MVKRDQIRRELQLRQPPARVLTAEAVQPQRAEGDGLMTQIRVLSDRTRSSGGVFSAGFNRRMRKTARTVVWESDGAQTPSLDPIKHLTQLFLDRHMKRLLSRTPPPDPTGRPPG